MHSACYGKEAESGVDILVGHNFFLDDQFVNILLIKLSALSMNAEI